MDVARIFFTPSEGKGIPYKIGAKGERLLC